MVKQETDHHSEEQQQEAAGASSTSDGMADPGQEQIHYGSLDPSVPTELAAKEENVTVRETILMVESQSDADEALQALRDERRRRYEMDLQVLEQRRAELHGDVHQHQVQPSEDGLRGDVHSSLWLRIRPRRQHSWGKRG